MRIFCFIFGLILLVASQEANAQNIVTVDLKPKFNSSLKGMLVSIKGFYSKAIKLDSTAWSEYELKWNLQDIRTVYKQYLDGIIDQEAFSKLFKQLDADSSELSTLALDSEISILVRVYKNKLVNVIPDENNNNSYVDDRVFEYIIGDSVGSSSFHYSTRNNPTFNFTNIHCSYNNRDTTISRTIVMQTEYNVFNIRNIKFYSNEVRSGSFRIDGKEYFVTLYFNPTAFLHNSKNFYYQFSDAVIDSSKKILSSRDTILLNGYMFKAKRRSSSSSTIDIEWMSEPQHIGFLEGSYIPNISLGKLLSKSKETSIKDYQNGNYLLVDFFGSWCLPCIENLPALKNLVARYSGKKLKVLGVGYEFTDDFAALNKLIETEKLTWSVVKTYRNQQNSIVKFANVYTFPTYLLISPKGKVLFSGSVADFPRFEKILAAELNQ